MIATRCRALRSLTASECTPHPVRSDRRADLGAKQVRWRGPDLNRRHHGFQPCALPTELPRPAGRKCSRTKRDVRTGATASRTSLCPNLTPPHPCGQGAPARRRRRSPQRGRSRAARARARTVGRGTQIGVRSPDAEGDRDEAAGPDHAVELVEERDHVVQRHEIEARVGERQLGRVRHLVALVRRAAAPRRSSRREASTPITSASGHSSASSRATARFPCRRRAPAPADRAATPAPRPSARAARGSTRVASHSGASRSKLRVSGRRKTRQRNGARTTAVVTSRAKRCRASRDGDPQLVARRGPGQPAASPLLIASVTRP